MTGVTDFFDRFSGFGQIIGADRRTYRAHRTSFLNVRTLQTGERVTFTPVEGPRGPRATNIELSVVETSDRAESHVSGRRAAPPRSAHPDN